MDNLYPKNVAAPVLLGTVDLRQAGQRNKMLLGDINSDGRMEMVMVQPDGGIDDRYVPHQVTCLTAFDLDGQKLWQVGTPHPTPGGPGSDYPAQIYDIDCDGYNEILCVMNQQFIIIDGRTGEIKETHALPSADAHDCIILANLSGKKHPQDIILKNRYQKMWALDNDFHLLWEHEGNIGHFPWAYDLNGDGRDEVMAGYDCLDANGQIMWSCRNLDDHADCIWVGDVDGNGDDELVIGGSVTVMYDIRGRELWRYRGSIESQHVSLGRFRHDLPGLQVAGLDRIIRGKENGKDGLFLLDSTGNELCKEDRTTQGWLTIIETLRGWDDGLFDYILAYRRGGGVFPTLYDGYLNPVTTFPVDGYVVHADLLGAGKTNVIIYTNDEAYIFGHNDMDLSSQRLGKTLPQPKRLYSSTLYPGGAYSPFA